MIEKEDKAIAEMLFSVQFSNRTKLNAKKKKRSSCAEVYESQIFSLKYKLCTNGHCLV